MKGILRKGILRKDKMAKGKKGQGALCLNWNLSKMAKKRHFLPFPLLIIKVFPNKRKNDCLGLGHEATREPE